MGSFKDYINRNNATVANNSSSSSSFMDYHNKMQKQREEEEKRKRQEKLRQQEEARKQKESQTEKQTEVVKPTDKIEANIYGPNTDTKKHTVSLIDALSNSIENKQETAPLYSKETIEKENGKLNEYKDSNDIVAIGSNILQGAKKGFMNFMEAGVSAVNNKWYENDELQQKLQKQGNELKEQAGKEPLEIKGTDDLYKEILGDSYNKDLFGRDKEKQKEKWNKTKQNINTKISLNIENAKTPIGRKLAELAPDIGQQLPGYVMPGGLGSIYFTGSAKGSYMKDAEQRGMTDKASNLYSGFMGTLEGLTDMIGAKLAKGVGGKIIKNNSKDALKLFGLDIAENFLEEAVMEPLSEITATLTGGKETANWDNMWSRMLNSGINGALSSIIMSGASAGLGKSVQVTNKINSNQQITTQEISDAVKETLQSNKVNKEELKNQIKANTNNIINQNVQALQNNVDTNIEKLNPIMQKDENLLVNSEQYVYNKEQRLEELKKIDTSEMGLLEKSKIKREIRALEAGYNSVEEYEQAEKNRIEKLKKDINQQKQLEQQENEINEVENNSTSFNLKEKQLEIIKASNPAPDDTHTWVRDINDIKTFKEAFFEDGDFSGMDPDFTESMAQESIRSGKITVYSSYPIEQGVFISPSKIEASQYAGGDTSKLYSKEVNINDIAWIDGAEGQYAKVEENLKQRNYIIDEKIAEYIKNTESNFKTNINIDTKILNTPDNLIGNYKNAKETVLYNKARQLFSNIHKRVFKNNNQNIYVTNADINESIHKTITNTQQKDLIKENLAVFSQLDKIIESGKLISSEKVDNKGRNEYSDYEYYASKANIDGQLYIVEFDTRLQKGTSGKLERHFRLERVYPINKTDSVSGTDNSMSHFGPESVSINNSITPQNENVNYTNKYARAS